MSTVTIRPYPSHYVRRLCLAGIGDLVIRPVRPEDEPAMVEFHQGLSEQSVHLRYFHGIGLSQRIAHPRLSQICHVDYDLELPLVVEHPSTGRIIAVGRLNRERDSTEAELALVVSDAWQSHGIGWRLAQYLIEVARAEKYRRLVAFVLPENRSMLALLQSHDFTVREVDGGAIRAELDLR